MLDIDILSYDLLLLYLNSTSIFLSVGLIECVGEMQSYNKHGAWWNLRLEWKLKFWVGNLSETQDVIL